MNPEAHQTLISLRAHYLKGLAIMGEIEARLSRTEDLPAQLAVHTLSYNPDVLGSNLVLEQVMLVIKADRSTEAPDLMDEYETALTKDLYAANFPAWYRKGDPMNDVIEKIAVAVTPSALAESTDDHKFSFQFYDAIDIGKRLALRRDHSEGSLRMALKVFRELPKFGRDPHNIMVDNLLSRMFISRMILLKFYEYVRLSDSYSFDDYVHRAQAMMGNFSNAMTSK